MFYFPGKMKSFGLLLAAAAGTDAWFVTNAALFMKKNIDPIVYPGEYVSHLHSFFGSDAITVNTNTSKELQEGGCTTASNPNDFSTYCKSMLEILILKQINNSSQGYPLFYM